MQAYCLHGALKVCLYRVLLVDGEPAIFIQLVLAFQSVTIKVMINLAELCLIIKRVCTGTILQCPCKKVLIGNSSNRKKSYSKVRRRVYKRPN